MNGRVQGLALCYELIIYVLDINFVTMVMLVCNIDTCDVSDGDVSGDVIAYLIKLLLRSLFRFAQRC